LHQVARNTQQMGTRATALSQVPLASLPGGKHFRRAGRWSLQALRYRQRRQ
jgi:hypothetical protein